MASPALKQDPETPRGFYEWTFPGAPIRILLQLDVVTRLSEYLSRGFTDASAPAEMGGLLLGSKQQNQVEITGFEPFVCGPRADRRFVVDGDDRARFAALLQHAEDRAGATWVMGYFRGQVGDELQLYPEDLDFIHALFTDPASVFLVVRPGNGDEPATAGFFFWDGDAIFDAFTFMPFPFDRSILEMGLARASEEPARTREEPGKTQEGPAKTREWLVRGYKEPARAAPEITKAPAFEQHTSPKGRFTLPVAGAVAAALVISTAVLWTNVAALWTKKRSLSPGPSNAPLALSISRSGPDVAITWNPASSVVRNARVGVLTIQDGNLRREVPLTDRMLVNNRIVYTPTSGKVDVALELFNSGGQRMRETVMLLLPSTRPSEALAPEPQAPLPAGLKVTVPASQPRESGRAVASPPSSFKEAAPPIWKPPPPPGSAREKPAAADVVEPPEPNPLANAGALPLPHPALPELQISPQMAPARIEESPQPGAASPESRTPVRTAPKPIQQIRPELPANLRSMVSQDIEVQVKVAVDASGRVTRAEPLPARGAVGEFLGKSSAAAALLWKFEPAREDGKPVSGELVLQFRFTPAKRK